MPNSAGSVDVLTRRSSSLLRMPVIGFTLALALLIAFPLPMAHAQLVSGVDCSCAKTGPFVDPNPGKAPFINASGDSAAASPRYRLSATEVGPNLPANVTIVRLEDSATVLQASGLFWGFSPDQDRFLIWSGTGSVFQADLYDLSAVPAVKRRTFAGAFTSLRFRFGKDGRFLLMAGLASGGTQVQVEYVNAETGDPRLIATLPITPTGTIDGDSDVAGWGFGPDSSRIVYSYISGGQPTVAMDNLDDGSPTPLVLRQLGTSAFWQFSPCGDTFGIVNQTAASQAEVDLWRTRDGGAAMGSAAFTSLDVSLATTAQQHQASIPGSTVDLAANAAGVSCMNAPPTADFSIAGTLEAGRTITFTDTSGDTDGTIASWSWTFGDGATSSLQNPTHVYSAGGAFNVALTVTDNGGKTADRTRALTLCSAAVAGGGRILYRAGNISGDLYTLNMDGSGEMRITNSDQTAKGQAGDGSADADYSPDGSKIAWVAIKINGFIGSGAGLSVSNADGSNKTVLLPYINDFMTIANPRWTPDGRSIAFYLRDTYSTPARHGIYLIDADGTNMRSVHQAAQNSAANTAIIAYPGGFSPVPTCGGGDGCLTLAVQYNTQGPGYNNSQIWKIRGDGSGLTRITTGTADFSPRFSPDGTKIAFIRGLSPQALHVMTAGGTAIPPVGTHQSNTWDSNPIWSPDGAQIAYTRTFYPSGTGATQRDIVVTNADGCHGDAVAIGSPFKNALSWTVGSAAQGQGSISGHVFYGNSLPSPSAAGIVVTAFWSGGSRSSQTDANGNYRINEIPAGVDITSISASFSGYVWVWPGTIAGFTGYQFPGFTGHAYGVFLGMQPDRFTLKGTVRDQDGNPVPDIAIEASGQPAPVAAVTTGGDGGFTLDLRPRLSYTVTPTTAGYAYKPLSASAWGDYGAVLTQNFTADRIVPAKGDINGDRLVDMTDAVLALQVVAGTNPEGILGDYGDSGVDINNDNRIGLEEALFIIQSTAELRSMSE